MKSISENGYNYLSVGSGQPILILHGLMGGLSNFDGVFKYFPKQGYQVIAPELPIYNSSLLNTNVKFFAKFVYKFIKFKNLRDVNGKKHITCRKCFGEPTSRGVFFRNLYDFLPKNFKDSKFINFLK